MLEHILTFKFLLEVILLVVVAFAVCAATSYYYRGAAERQIHLAFFMQPINNTLLILTFLLPTLIAVTATLLSTASPGQLATLLASLLAFLCVLATSFWLSASLFKKGSENEIVTLVPSSDLHYVKAFGIIYAFMLVGFLYGAGYFLLEYEGSEGSAKPASAAYTQPATGSSLPASQDWTIAITRHPVTVDLTRAEVERLWGAPDLKDPSGNHYHYSSPTSRITVTFALDDSISAIEFRRKETNQ